VLTQLGSQLADEPIRPPRREWDHFDFETSEELIDLLAELLAAAAIVVVVTQHSY